MKKPEELEISEVKDDFKGRSTNQSKRNRNKQKGRNNNKGKYTSNGSAKFKGKTTNDPAWYSTSPELLRDSSSIPFSWPVGTPMRTGTKVVLDTIPGVCVLKLVPTVGNSLNENSPINVAASKIYTWVRSANSGSKNYDAPDLMMYLLAMSNIYSFVNWMQRVYAYLMLYDQRNKYLPRALAAADGIDFDDFRDNLANFRFFLNEYITEVSTLAVPNTMTIFPRLAMLYSNVYSEGPSIKDQLYMYAPRDLAWYQFGLNSSTSAGELTLTPMTVAGSAATVKEVTTYAKQLFNAIWQQEDFNIMSGDILKAYEGHIIKLMTIPEITGLTPIYDTMVLHQIKNAKIIPWLSIGKISQDPATGVIAHSIIINPSATATNKSIALSLGELNKIISTDIDQPGPEIVIESTRLMPAYDSYQGLFEAGTEIAGNAVYYYYDNNGVLQSELENGPQHIYFASTGGDGNWCKSLLRCEQIIANFKYHPETFRFSLNDDGTVKEIFRNWDVDNYAVLSNETLVKMHTAALLSLFGVPSVARIN